MNTALHAIAQDKARSLIANVVTLESLKQFQAECDECNAYANGNAAIIQANNEYRDLVLRYIREMQA